MSAECLKSECPHGFDPKEPHTDPFCISCEEVVALVEAVHKMCEMCDWGERFDYVVCEKKNAVSNATNCPLKRWRPK